MTCWLNFYLFFPPVLCPVGPEEVKVKGDEEVELDDTVTLTCEVNSVPMATYTWTFNSTVLAEKSKTLSIEKATYKDSGNYTCEAYNSVTGKKASSSHFLSVKGEFRGTRMQILHQLQKQMHKYYQQHIIPLENIFISYKLHLKSQFKVCFSSSWVCRALTF